MISILFFWTTWPVGRTYTLRQLLTLYTLTSVCISSLLFSIHSLSCWQGEFVEQSKAFLVGDHFPYSRHLNLWFRGNIVRRNYKLITQRVQRVNTMFNFPFSLDPDEDPLGVLLMIDFYALQSEQFSFLIRLFEEWEVNSVQWIS